MYAEFLVGKLETEMPLGRPRHKWEDIIRMDLKLLECVDWMHLAEDRDQWQTLVNTNELLVS